MLIHIFLKPLLIYNFPDSPDSLTSESLGPRLIFIADKLSGYNLKISSELKAMKVQVKIAHFVSFLFCLFAPFFSPSPTG